MKHPEVVEWTLRVMDSIASKHRVEDDRVEAKREWPDPPNKAARRIAAQANAARGNSFLWLIGVDEVTGEIIPPVEDPADLWRRVKAEFDGDPPRPMFVKVKDVQAICFEPESPPYVVRNAAYGTEADKVQYEVPWREGTSVRSARHDDLIRILVPRLRSPEIEIRDVRLRASSTQDPAKTAVRVLGTLYIAPVSQDQFAIPFHRCTCDIVADDKPCHASFTRCWCESQPGVPSATVHVSNLELVCRGAGHARLRVTSLVPRDEIWSAQNVRLDLQFPIVPGELVGASIRLPSIPGTGSDTRDWGSPQAPTP